MNEYLKLRLVNQFDWLMCGGEDGRVCMQLSVSCWPHRSRAVEAAIVLPIPGRRPLRPLHSLGVGTVVSPSPLDGSPSWQRAAGDTISTQKRSVYRGTRQVGGAWDPPGGWGLCHSARCTNVRVCASSKTLSSCLLTPVYCRCQLVKECLVIYCPSHSKYSN